MNSRNKPQGEEGRGKKEEGSTDRGSIVLVIPTASVLEIRIFIQGLPFSILGIPRPTLFLLLLGFMFLFLCLRMGGDRRVWIPRGKESPA